MEETDPSKVAPLMIDMATGTGKGHQSPHACVRREHHQRERRPPVEHKLPANSVAEQAWEIENHPGRVR